jgi:hypothetical protein
VSRALSWFPIAAARKVGSADSKEISPTVVQELVDATWGLVLLILGFFGQAVGSFLPAICR